MLSIANARSFLFVPVDRPERFEKALASGADAVIFDLEDAVGPGQKEEARVLLKSAWSGFSAATRARCVVRINADGTPFHDGDVGLAGFVSEAELAHARRLVDAPVITLAQRTLARAANT